MAHTPTGRLQTYNDISMRWVQKICARYKDKDPATIKYPDPILYRHICARLPPKDITIEEMKEGYPWIILRRTTFEIAQDYYFITNNSVSRLGDKEDGNQGKNIREMEMNCINSSFY